MKKPLFSFFVSLAMGEFVSAANYDIYEAKTGLTDSASYPVVVFVHGGAWVSGSKEQYRAIGEGLAKHKICAVVVDYSLAPKVQHPKPVEELDAIIRELTSKKQGRCWWDRTYLMGHSAGAHMIAMWNATYENPSVRGFIGLEGIYDLERLLKVWPGYKDWFVTKAFGADATKYAAASPRGLKMKSKEPWLVVHSEKDELVDLAQSIDFDKAVREQGIKSEVLNLKEGSHFGVVEALRGPEADVTKKVLEYVRRFIP